MGCIAKCNRHFDSNHTRIPLLQRAAPLRALRMRNHIPCVSRPALSILKLFDFELDETLWAKGKNCIVSTAEDIHNLKSSVLLNRTLPTRQQIWQEAERLANYFGAIGVSSVLCVPGSAQKRPANNILYAAHHPPDARWSSAVARDPSRWWPNPVNDPVDDAATSGRRECVGLLIGEDVIVVDFDKLDKEENLAFFEHVAGLCPLDSPMEFTKGGAHMFFRQSDYGRRVFQFLTRLDDIDVITIAGTGSPSYIEIAPSKFKRAVPGRRLGDGPLPVVPAKVIDALVMHQRATAAQRRPTQTDGLLPDGGEAALERPSPPKMPRLAFGSHWLHELTASEAKTLFAAVGMTEMMCSTKGSAQTTFMRCAPGGRCYLPHCVRTDHDGNFEISTFKTTGHVTIHHVGTTFRIKTADGTETIEKQGFVHVPLTASVLRALHAAWARWPGSKCKAASTDAVFAVDNAHGYEWRVFTPWLLSDRDADAASELRIGAELWCTPNPRAAAGPTPWLDVKHLERLGFSDVHYRHEYGPLDSNTSFRYGESAYCWRFLSGDRCPKCFNLHDDGFSVVSFAADVNKPVLFARCCQREGVGLIGGQLPPLTAEATLRETRKVTELAAMFAEPIESGSARPSPLTDSAEDIATFGALLDVVKAACGQRAAMIKACSAVFASCWDAPWVCRAKVRPIEPGQYFEETYGHKAKAAGYCSTTGFYVVCSGKADFRVVPKRKSAVPLRMPSNYAEWCVDI